MSIWAVNLLLTLPNDEGWHDRLLIANTPRGTTAYVVHTRLGSTPLTPAILEVAHVRAMQSLHPWDVAARRELTHRR